MIGVSAPPAAAPVALLFTDLTGSTELLGRIGDDAGQEFLNDHFRMLREVMSTYEGEEVKCLGDGLMVAFEHPERAAACAAEMQRRMEVHNRQHPDRRVGLRVGVNAGQAIRSGGDYFGMAVVVAKRLCDRALAGQVLLSEHVRRPAGGDGGYAFGDLGALSLKGVADPVRAWTLTWQTTPSESERTALPVEQGSAGADLHGADGWPVPPVLAGVAEGRFVGRVEPLGALHGEYERASRGERRMVALAGEPGIGKTRLAAEAASRAGRRGALVLYGRCDEEPLMPYQPFAEALAQYVADRGHDELLRAAGDAVSSLARIVPELGTHPADQVEEPAGDPQAERYRLFEAMTRLLGAIAGAAPVVLVLDDLHWADKPTLLMLRYLMRAPGRCPLLVIGTYRDSEVTTRHPLSDTISDLQRARAFERIRLEGLAESDVEALAAKWAGQPAPSGVASAIWRETEGHPFFVEETLRHLLETGAIFERRGRLGSDGAARHIPDSVKDVIGSRLARLPDPVSDVLTTASVLGRQFSLELLQRLSGVALDPLLRLLEEAVASRLIEPATEAADRYTFSHALVRDVLYEALLPSRRAHLHAQLAEALDELQGTVREQHLADLAYHYFRAEGHGDALTKAITYSIAAGRRASGQFAYEEAAGHYDRALDGLAAVAQDPARQCEVLLALGDARWNSGDLAGAREAFSRAADVAQELGLADHHARAALGFAGRIGFRAGVVDRPLIALLERSLELLGEREVPLRAMVTAQLAEALASSAPLERRRTLCQAAEELARRSADKAVLAFVLQRSTWAMWRPDNVRERLARAREVLELASELDDTITAIEARITVLAAELELGLPADALDDSLAELAARVAEARQPYYEWLLLSIQSMRALYDRPIGEAERLARQALDAVQVTQHPAALELYGTQLVYIRFLQGRMGEMHASVSAYAELFVDVGVFRAALALVYAELGQEDQARRELDVVAADDFAAVRRDQMWLTAMNTLTVVCSELGDMARCARLYDLLQPHADNYCALGAVGVPSCSWQRHLGMLATTLSRFDTAERHFESALGRNDDLGVTVSVALTKLEYGRMLLARRAHGDTEKALGLLRQAAAEATQLGMARIANRAREAEFAEESAPDGKPYLRSDAPAVLAERLVRTGSDAKAIFSTRTRAAVGRRFGAAPAADLQRVFGSTLAQRTLLTAMATSFQPRMAFGFRGEIQLELLPPEDEGLRPSNWWTLEIKGNRASAQRRIADRPAVTLHVDVPTFIRLFGGELNPVGAWLDGQLEVEGDVLLAPRMIELFGGVKPIEDLASASTRGFDPALSGE